MTAVRTILTVAGTTLVATATAVAGVYAAFWAGMTWEAWQRRRNGGRR